MEQWDIYAYIQSNEIDLSSIEHNKVICKIESVYELFGLAHIENIDLSNSSIGLNINLVKRILTGSELCDNSNNFKFSNLKCVNLSKNKIDHNVIEMLIDCTFSSKLKSIILSKNQLDFHDILKVLEMTLNNPNIDNLDVSYCSYNENNCTLSPYKKSQSKQFIGNSLKGINDQNNKSNSSKFDIEMDMITNNKIISYESKDDFEINKCSFKFSKLMKENVSNIKLNQYLVNSDNNKNHVENNAILLSKKLKHDNLSNILNSEELFKMSTKKVLNYSSPDPNRLKSDLNNFNNSSKYISNLQTLNLSGNCLGDHNLNKLFNTINKFISLKNMDLSDNMMGDNCFKHISQYLNSSNSKNLEIFNLSNNSPSIKGINLLFRVLQKRKSIIKISMYKSLCTVSMITKFRILMKQNQKVNILFEDTDLYFMTSDDDKEFSDKNIEDNEKSSVLKKRKNSIYSFSKENDLDLENSIDNDSLNEDDMSDNQIIKKHKTNKIPYKINKTNFNCNNKGIIDYVRLSEQFDHLNLNLKEN